MKMRPKVADQCFGTADIDGNLVPRSLDQTAPNSLDKLSEEKNEKVLSEIKSETDKSEVKSSPLTPGTSSTTSGTSSATSGKCTDRNKKCMFWASAGECQRNRLWMYRICQMSCRVCAWNQKNSRWFSKKFLSNFISIHKNFSILFAFFKLFGFNR